MRVLGDLAGGWVEHDELIVAGQPVDWWLDDDGRVHACTVDGLARGLAWSAGRWDLRLLLAAALETPTRLASCSPKRAWSLPRPRRLPPDRGQFGASRGAMITEP